MTQAGLVEDTNSSLDGNNKDRWTER